MYPPQPAKNSKVSFIIKIIIIIAEKYSPHIKTNFLLRMSVSPTPPPFSKLSFAAKKNQKSSGKFSVNSIYYGESYYYQNDLVYYCKMRKKIPLHFY